jgi:hypothetical protein
MSSRADSRGERQIAWAFRCTSWGPKFIKAARLLCQADFILTRRYDKLHRDDLLYKRSCHQMGLRIEGNSEPHSSVGQLRSGLRPAMLRSPTNVVSFESMNLRTFKLWLANCYFAQDSSGFPSCYHSPVGNLVVLFIHFIALARSWQRPFSSWGVASFLSFNKHQLLILNRSRQRSPRLSTWDRILAGFDGALGASKSSFLVDVPGPYERQQPQTN